MGRVRLQKWLRIIDLDGLCITKEPLRRLTLSFHIRVSPSARSCWHRWRMSIPIWC